QGGGTFGDPIDQTGLCGGDLLTISDVNSDGVVDFVSANNEDNTIRVTLNQGGTFGTPLKYASGGVEPSDVIAHDINTDGKLDLLVVNKYSNNVSVLLNTCLP
ncbi:MAG TPA: VCBS repeat-containing protein, partial [Polyangium sp.]|nr:VCBS repeat-containing protein [Polyangium sp.]